MGGAKTNGLYRKNQSGTRDPRREGGSLKQIVKFFVFFCDIFVLSCMISCVFFTFKDDFDRANFFVLMAIFALISKGSVFHFNFYINKKDEK